MCSECRTGLLFVFRTADTPDDLGRVQYTLDWRDHTVPGGVRGQVFFGDPAVSRARLERRGGRWAQASSDNEAARMILQDAGVPIAECAGGCGRPVAVLTDELDIALYDSDGRCGRCVPSWPPRRDNALVDRLLAQRGL